MTTQRRCLDCGVLFGTPHELWCPSTNAQKERHILSQQERRADEGSSPDAWPVKPYYAISAGPLPVMLDHNDLMTMARMRRKEKEK